jgi:hypothetical protein
MARSSGRIAFALILTSLVIAGCGGGSSKMAGKWTKSMEGEGDVVLTIDGKGAASFALPDGRWPAPVDVQSMLTMQGDSLTIASETGPSACAQPAPKYVVAISGTSMTIGGGSSDPCGARHEVLVGTWTKS